MNILLVTEIWGRTPYLESLATALRSTAAIVSVVDPYCGVDPHFSSEDEAYAHYLAECGHDEFARRVAHAVATASEPIFLVGFSAGAGAVWQVVTKGENDVVKRAACFYGSSIRTMSERTPTVQTDLIFSCFEPHFAVDEVMMSMQGKAMVHCHKADHGHGFMNPLSKNYSEKGYAQWLAWIRDKATSARDQLASVRL